MDELLIESIEHLAFACFQQSVVSVEQLIDNFATMVLLAENSFAQFSIGLAKGIFDTPKVRSQTDC